MDVETNIYYSPKDLAKRCWGCAYLAMYDDWNGKCECNKNKIKLRDREITSKACVWKKMKEDENAN